MQSSDNGYVIEFYTTGATEPSVLEIQDKRSEEHTSELQSPD